MKASWRITIIGMMLSLVVGMGGSFAWSTKKDSNQLMSNQQSFQAVHPHVSALGTIAPQGRIRHVAAPSSFSRIGRLLVEEGDRVTRGQVLAHSDDHKLRISELAQADSQVCIAQSKLDRLLAGPDPHEVNALAASLSSAMESREQRKREFDRVSTLCKKQFCIPGRVRRCKASRHSNELFHPRARSPRKSSYNPYATRTFECCKRSCKQPSVVSRLLSKI